MKIDIQFEESNQSIYVDFWEIQIIGGSVVEATIEPLTVTENGTYTAQGDVDGYSPIHVDVPIPDGYIQPQGTIEITENGEYGITEYANAIVNVEEAKEEQEKTIDITENGTTEVTPDDGKVLSKVTVNVDVEKGITPSGTLEIAENGEYDVTEYASANVNVESGSDNTVLKSIIERTATDIVDDSLEVIQERTFYEYKTLKTVELKNVKVLPIQAFHNCTSLTSANLSKVTEIGNFAFYNCTSLTSIDLPNVTSIGNNAFRNCTSLTSIDLPNVTSIGNNAFRNCTSLTSIDLSKVIYINVSGFYNCTSLTSIDLPNVTSIGMEIFRNCSSLTSIDLSKVTSIEMEAFYNCTSLTSVIIRTQEMCNISVKALLNTKIITREGSPTGEGFIYVPSALLESYITDMTQKVLTFATENGTPMDEATATSMSTSIFRALEDYTVDGTTTGELDESKI